MIKFQTSTGETVTGKRLQKALNSVADEWLRNAINMRLSCDYASHVTEVEKDEILKTNIDLTIKIRNGESRGFTIWQRVNLKLTGDCVALLP